MSSLETTELKLKTTPTAGVDAAHSPYYRRLLSAGYKGFLQGTIGGASLYGVFGAVIGGLAAAPFLGPMGILYIALAGGTAGVLKGASTFGQIGSMAAITAESSDLSEQRRYLLDRYYDLPEGPEGDREAKVIREELEKRSGEHIENPPFFHWKTVAVCAAVGAVLGLLALTVPPIAGALGMHALAFGVPLTAGSVATTTSIIAGGSIAGALVGGTVGIDRYYIRKWFDHTQNVVHDSSHKESALMARDKLIGRMRTASQEDQKTKQDIYGARVDAAILSAKTQPTIEQTPAPPVASLDKPTNKVSEATLKQRVADLQHSLAVSGL